MKIRIKMYSVLNDKKGFLSKKALEKKLRATTEKIFEEYAPEDIHADLLEKIIDTFSTEFAGKIPKDFTYEFNRLVAGLMGATCYMPDDFEALSKKTTESILRIADQVENNGHHSTFGHAHLTLEISGISKALAMVLNNEKEYNTSEKSARYTVMKDIEPEQKRLYDKWLEIFEKKINDTYPAGMNKFFDPEGKKARKLAQENARYMISVFTPTNMVYTTSFRQLNYLAHWMEKETKNPSNNFYAKLKDEMTEFVAWMKSNNLYGEKLSDGKNRGFTLFGDPILKTIYSSSYQNKFKMSFACLAQAQRHRTNCLRINRFKFLNDFEKNNEFYIPPIIREDKELAQEYLKDIKSVAKYLPQGTMVEVSEQGTFETFTMKIMERICVLAQKEIRDISIEEVEEYYEDLTHERDLCYDEDLLQVYDEYIRILKSFMKGSRCKSGRYTCPSPCGNKDGVEAKSLV